MKGDNIVHICNPELPVHQELKHLGWRDDTIRGYCAACIVQSLADEAEAKGHRVERPAAAEFWRWASGWLRFRIKSPRYAYPGDDEHIICDGEKLKQ